MLDLFFISLAVFVMSFVSDQTIPGSEATKAFQYCASYGGLKSLRVTQVFSRKSYTALCVNGTQISGDK